MKSMMKKTLSVIIALAMILVPMSVFAAQGDADQPYQLSTDSFRFSIYVAPGATAYVQATDTNNTVVTVGYVGGVESGEQSFDYVVQYGRQYLMADRSGAVVFQMTQGYDTFTFTNNSEEEVFAMMSLQPAPVAGTWDNPEIVELLEDNGYGYSTAIDFEEGNEGYYFQTTAPDNGAICVSAYAEDPNNDYAEVPYMITVNNLTAGVYGDQIISTDVEFGYVENCEVSAGDVVEVFVTPINPDDMWNAPACSMYVDISFATPGSWMYPATPVLGENSVDFAEGSGYYLYEWLVPEDGVVTVTMDDASGWEYSVGVEAATGDWSDYYYGDTHWSDDDPVVASESVEVVAGDILSVSICTYNPDDPYNAPAGTVNWSLAFEAGATLGGDGDDDIGGGGDIGGGDEEELNYADYTSTYLELGEHMYVVDGSYPYTVYTFEPTETGKYTFSSDNSVMGIVSYNGMWVTIDPSADTVNANEFSWECTSAGQSIWVAVMADTNVATIEITREDVEAEEIPTIIYDNETTPEAFEYDGDAAELLPVDFEDDVIDSAVLGEDGFYHLNSADGPILYVNLNDSILSMVTLLGVTSLNAYTIEDGEIVEKIEFYDAMMEYINNADVVEVDETTMYLYPLTDDLMLMYQAGGANKGWYGDDEFAIIGPVEDGWMFACYYAETVPGGSNEGNEGEGNEGTVVPNPEIPNTGAEVFGVAFAMMATAAALGATVVTTKKSKRVK